MSNEPSYNDTNTNEVDLRSKHSKFFRKKDVLNQSNQVLTSSIHKSIQTSNVFTNHYLSKLSTLIRKRYNSSVLFTNKPDSKLSKFIQSSNPLSHVILIKMIYISIQALVSFVAVLLYIIRTYYPNEDDAIDDSTKATIRNIKMAELVISVIITLNYIVSFFLAKRKVKFLFNLLNLLDLISVVPCILNLIKIEIKSLGFVRIFRMIKVMRIFQVKKVLSNSNYKGIKENQNETIRRLISSLLAIVAIAFLATGVIHFLTETFPSAFDLYLPSESQGECLSGSDFSINELIPYREGINTSVSCPEGDVYIKKPGNITFDIAFYYVIVTMTTVGYGDIYPTTGWMRLLLTGLIFITIFAFSRFELKDFVKLNMRYSGKYRKQKGMNHIILSGFFSKTGLSKFLNEFYHEDHKEKADMYNIVLIQDKLPNKDIQGILLNPKFDESITYIHGALFGSDAMVKAEIKSASAVILKNDQNINDENCDLNDQYLILLCKEVSQQTSAPIYVQFNNSKSLLHHWADWSLAFSTQDIKMNIIIKNGFVPGFATMIMNLIKSISESNTQGTKFKAPWLTEYFQGAGQEFYIIKPPDDFDAIDFSSLSEIAYLTCGALVIGIKRCEVYEQDSKLQYYSYILNPISYKVSRDDYIIVIADDEEDAMQIFQINSIKNLPIIQQESDNNDYIETNTYIMSNPNTNVQATRSNQHHNNHLMMYLVDESLQKDNNTNEGGNNRNGSGIRQTQTKEFMKSNTKNSYQIWKTSKAFRKRLYDHFVLFCKEEQLLEFMKCFNNAFDDIIFFISPKPQGNQWDIIVNHFKNVIFIECSYSDQDNLRKLNLDKAKHVFILSNTIEKSNISDSGILPLVKFIEDNYAKCNYSLELVDELNMKYVTKQETEGIINGTRNNYHKKTVQSETYYMRQENNHDKEDLPSFIFSPKYAESQILFSSDLDSLLAFSFHNEGAFDTIMALIGDSKEIESKVKSNHSMGVYKYEGDNEDNIIYEQVVQFFMGLSPPVIPIAVYRGIDHLNLKNEAQYIVTNPKAEMILGKNDKIICIGRVKGNYLKKNKMIQYKMTKRNEEENNYSNDDKEEEEESEDENENAATLKEELESLPEKELLRRLTHEIECFEKIIYNKGGMMNKNKTVIKDKYKIDPFNQIDEKNELEEHLYNNNDDGNELIEAKSNDDDENDNDNRKNSIEANEIKEEEDDDDDKQCYSSPKKVPKLKFSDSEKDLSNNSSNISHFHPNDNDNEPNNNNQSDQEDNPDTNSRLVDGTNPNKDSIEINNFFNLNRLKKL